MKDEIVYTAFELHVDKTNILYYYRHVKRPKQIDVPSYMRSHIKRIDPVPRTTEDYLDLLKRNRQGH